MACAFLSGLKFPGGLVVPDAPLREAATGAVSVGEVVESRRADGYERSQRTIAGGVHEVGEPSREHASPREHAVRTLQTLAAFDVRMPVPWLQNDEGEDAAEILRDYYPSVRAAQTLLHAAPWARPAIEAQIKHVSIPERFKGSLYRAVESAGATFVEPAGRLGDFDAKNYADLMSAADRGRFERLKVSDEALKETVFADRTVIHLSVPDGLSPGAWAAVVRLYARAAELDLPLDRGVSLPEYLRELSYQVPDDLDCRRAFLRLCAALDGLALRGRGWGSGGRFFADPSSFVDQLPRFVPRVPLGRRSVSSSYEQRGLSEAQDLRLFQLDDRSIERLFDEVRDSGYDSLLLRLRWHAAFIHAISATRTDEDASKTALRLKHRAKETEVGALHVFRRATELGVPTVFDFASRARPTSKLVDLREAIALRALARAKGKNLARVEIGNIPLSLWPAREPAFPKSRQPSFPERFDEDQLIEMLKAADPRILSADDESMRILTRKLEKVLWDVQGGFVALGNLRQGKAWVLDMLGFIERISEIDPSVAGSILDYHYVSKCLREEHADDPEVMESIARILFLGQGSAVISFAGSPGHLVRDAPAFSSALERVLLRGALEAAAVPFRGARLRFLDDPLPGGLTTASYEEVFEWMKDGDERILQLDDDTFKNVRVSQRAINLKDLIRAWPHPHVFHFAARAAEQRALWTSGAEAVLSSPIPEALITPESCDWIARIAERLGLLLSEIRVMLPNLETTPLVEHGAFTARARYSPTARKERLDDALRDLDPAGQLLFRPTGPPSRLARTPGAFHRGLEHLFGDPPFEFSELVPNLVQARLEGRLHPLTQRELPQPVSARILDALESFGHVGAIAVLGGLLFDPPDDLMHAAFDRIGYSAEIQARFCRIAKSLVGLNARDLLFALADVTRCPEEPDFTTLELRHALVGTEDEGEIQALFDAVPEGTSGAKQDVLRILLERVAMEPPESREHARLKAFVGRLVASGRVLPGDVHALVPDSIERNWLASAGRAVTDASLRYAEAPSEATLRELESTVRNENAFAPAESLVEHALLAIRSIELEKRVPLGDLDMEMDRSSGTGITIDFDPENPPSGAMVQIGVIELPFDTRPDKDNSLVPRLGDIFFEPTDNAMRSLVALARAFLEGSPLLFEGPTSAGKNAVVRFLAALTGAPLRRFNFSEDTKLNDLFGRWVAAERRFDATKLAEVEANELRRIAEEYGVDPRASLSEIRSGILVAQDRPRFVPGPLLLAARRGEILLFDELDLASEDLLLELRALFDPDGSFIDPETGNRVHPVPGFHLVACQNGITEAGRSSSLVGIGSNWHRVKAKALDGVDLRQILTKKYGDEVPMDLLAGLIQAHQMVERMVEVGDENGRAGKELGHVAFTLRNLYRVLDRFLEFRGISLSDGALLRREFEEVYLDLGFSREDRARLEDKARLTLPYDGPDFYEALEFVRTAEGLSFGDVPLTRIQGIESDLLVDTLDRTVWTPRMKKAFCLLTKAAHMKENVALVGREGMGRETLSRAYASARGLPFYGQPFSRGMGARRLIGGSTANGFLPSRLLRSLDPKKSGGVFFGKNFEQASPGIQERLNSLLDDDRRLTVVEDQGQEIRGHPEFVFIATLDPDTLRSSYGGPRLSRPLKNRLTLIEVPDMDVGEAKAIVEQLAVWAGLGRNAVEARNWGAVLFDLQSAVEEAYVPKEPGTAPELGARLKSYERPRFGLPHAVKALKTLKSMQRVHGPPRPSAQVQAFLDTVDQHYANMADDAERRLVLASAEGALRHARG